MGGKRPGGPCECLHLDQESSPRKNPSSTMRRILLGMDIAEGKRGNLPLVVRLHIVPQDRKITKAEKDTGENRSV